MNWPPTSTGTGRSSRRQTIRKAPSAELRPDQTDQDTLPPLYDLLDRIMNYYLTEGCAYEDIVKLGFEA